MVLRPKNILNWVDAQANLPTRARWIAKADVAPGGATKREQRRPSHETEGLLFSASVIDPSTVQAYLETEYRVHGQPGFALRIDQASADLLRLQQEHGAECSAFLSACNPFSRPCTDEENAARCVALTQELRRRGFEFLPWVGQHPSNDWPGEKSALVLGLPLEEAKALASDFEQNGFVWSVSDAVPQLILLR